jgi:hypothetical protein
MLDWSRQRLGSQQHFFVFNYQHKAIIIDDAINVVDSDMQEQRHFELLP